MKQLKAPLLRAAIGLAILLLTWAYTILIVPQDGIIDPRETILFLIGVLTGSGMTLTGSITCLIRIVRPHHKLTRHIGSQGEME